MTTRPLLEELLEFALRLAVDAGEIALSHFGKNLRADRKADGTIMTAADRQAEQLMRRRLQGTFTDWHGRRTIDGGNAISTNGALFADVMKLVRASS